MPDKTYYEDRYAEEIRYHWIKKEKASLAAVLLLLAAEIVQKFVVASSMTSSSVQILLYWFVGRFVVTYLEERSRERYYKGLLKDKPPFS
jgi:hypothetical protein